MLSKAYWKIKGRITFHEIDVTEKTTFIRVGAEWTTPIPFTYDSVVYTFDHVEKYVKEQKKKPISIAYDIKIRAYT